MIRSIMSRVEMLEQEIRRLPTADARALHAWLADFLEDQEELSPKFVQRIEEGRQDLAAGRVRRVSRAPK